MPFVILSLISTNGRGRGGSEPPERLPPAPWVRVRVEAKVDRSSQNSPSLQSVFTQSLIAPYEPAMQKKEMQKKEPFPPRRLTSKAWEIARARSTYQGSRVSSVNEKHSAVEEVRLTGACVRKRSDATTKHLETTKA